ncbi:hypothetical protein D2V93_04930 [Flagellimonas taeanensis]|uniref:hypothetical protein n=1 Tax=Flavobacteriaceae TaxID=49546 RepID=UPI000E6A48EC|nr:MULTISPECIES: hypothetical protein [Allomuricauda]MDC6386417.1 hypothetical protein [Muricauda sp. SK9]RIV52002.1 hypothetical protein D2V93_04930 [Allomuricauda taeanensis]
MATGITLLIFIGFYLLYGTSQKMAMAGNLGLEKWIGGHARISKYSGSALLIISLGLSCLYWGAASGTFTYFVILMTIASLVVLLAPLRILNPWFLTLTLVLSIICEIVLF